MTSFPEYGEREARFAASHRFGDWHVKVYAIDAGGRTRPDDAMAAAVARIPELLPDSSHGGSAGAEVHDDAFAIVHAGADAVWLLVDWWADACLLHHRMVAAPLADPTEFSITVPETLIACSWELAVVSYERDAWVRNVQGRGRDADLEAYRADVMGPTLV